MIFKAFFNNIGGLQTLITKCYMTASSTWRQFSERGMGGSVFPHHMDIALIFLANLGHSAISKILRMGKQPLSANEG